MLAKFSFFFSPYTGIFEVTCCDCDCVLFACNWAVAYLEIYCKKSVTFYAICESLPIGY